MLNVKWNVESISNRKYAKPTTFHVAGLFDDTNDQPNANEMNPNSKKIFRVESHSWRPFTKTRIKILIKRTLHKLRAPSKRLYIFYEYPI